MSANAREMHGVDGKVIIVTGSGRGVGRGMALHLGGGGARIVVAEWKEHLLTETCAELTALGVMLIPFSIAFVSVGPLSGYLSDKYGPRNFATGGLIISAIAFFWFSILPTKVPYAILVQPMILVGLGAGMFVAPNISSIMNASPVARRGIAAGMSATMITVGFLLSMGVAFVILASSMPLSTLEAIFAGLPVGANAVNIDLFTMAMHEMFLLMAVISLVAAVPSSLRGPKIEYAKASLVEAA
jgi:MFS family permease